MADEGMTVLFLEVEAQSFAVEVLQVETLRRKETVFPADQAFPGLLGFLPLGAALAPILDLGTCLGVARKEGKSTGLLIVPPEGVTPLAFRVDRAVGPVHVPWQQLALLPEMLRKLQPRPITWAFAWQGEAVVPVLDLAQIVPPAEVATLMELAANIPR